MQKRAKELEMHAKSLGVNYEVRRDLCHEHMKCDCNIILKFVLKMCSLDKISSRHEGVEIALTLDGAIFTSHAAHVACGVKVVGVRARDPKCRDLPLNFQSREYSYVFKMYLMKDTKDGHEHFKKFFEWGREISEQGTPACASRAELKPMKVPFPVDLSAAWKLLIRCGAAKIKTCPCHCCST